MERTHHPAAIDAVDAVIAGDQRNAVALARPPGHHAEPDRAMGFCVLSNVAIAAARAAERGVERILVVDWDVHHGNGTERAFEERRDVLFLSSHHGYGFYPGSGDLDDSGKGAGRGFTVNAPLAGGGGDSLYFELYCRLLVPIADAFAPQLILVSAGFDAHVRDPLGGMRMTEAGFAALTALVQELADRHTGGRVAVVLEGGYDLEGLAGGVRACLEVLGGKPAPPIPPPNAQELREVDAICDFHCSFWPTVANS